MAANCDVCGKGPGFGHSISHSHRRTKRRWNPNIQRVRAVVGGDAEAASTCAPPASRPARSPRLAAQVSAADCSERPPTRPALLRSLGATTRARRGAGGRVPASSTPPSAAFVATATTTVVEPARLARARCGLDAPHVASAVGPRGSEPYLLGIRQPWSTGPMPAPSGKPAARARRDVRLRLARGRRHVAAQRELRRRAPRPGCSRCRGCGGCRTGDRAASSSVAPSVSRSTGVAGQVTALDQHPARTQLEQRRRGRAAGRPRPAPGSR